MQTSLVGETEKITADDIRKALRTKYKTENYLKMEEFDEYSSGRRIDFMAMSLVRSRPGIHGIEIKISRSDWLHELNTSKKADAFYFCDFYYLASPPGIWQNGEVPLTWGILEYIKGKIKVVREPTQLPSRYDFMFLKTLVGRVLKPESSELAKAKEESYRLGYAAGINSSSLKLKWDSVNRELEMYKKNFEEFKRKSGIDLYSVWDLGRIGNLVKKVKDKQESEESIDRYKNHLENVIETLQRLKDKMYELEATQ